MCLRLPARVISVDGGEAEEELLGGMRATASTVLRPDLAVGQHVLFDRGLVIEVIAADEADAILELYDEIGRLLREADTVASASGVDGWTAPADGRSDGGSGADWGAEAGAAARRDGHD